MGSCGRCGDEHRKHYERDGLCFECWYFERGAENPDAVFQFVSRLANNLSEIEEKVNNFDTIEDAQVRW
jgi:hypothetical protein